MHDLRKAMAAALAGMSAQSLRLRLSAENLAASDVPGFRRKMVSFETVLGRGGAPDTVRPGPVRLSSAPARQEYDPSHPLADERGAVTFSNVDPLIELADAREAQRSYEAGLGIYGEARQMHGSMLDLLRR